MGQAERVAVVEFCLGGGDFGSVCWLHLDVTSVENRGCWKSLLVGAFLDKRDSKAGKRSLFAGKLSTLRFQERWTVVCVVFFVAYVRSGSAPEFSSAVLGLFVRRKG